MTIKKFQELYYISTQEISDVDKAQKYVECYTGKTPDQVEAMSLRRFNILCAKVTKVFTELTHTLDTSTPKKGVIIKGRIYRINYDIKKQPFNAGKYVEIATFAADPIMNLHKIMATLATPVSFYGKDKKRTHEEISEDFESMNFVHAYQACVFFYAVMNNSIKALRPYLVKELTTKGVSQQAADRLMKDSLNILDGFSMPRWYRTLKVSV